jgi:hypothetical protein
VWQVNFVLIDYSKLTICISSIFRPVVGKIRYVAPEDRRAPLSWASGLSLDYDDFFFNEELVVEGTKARHFGTELRRHFPVSYIQDRLYQHNPIGLKDIHRW